MLEAKGKRTEGHAGGRLMDSASLLKLLAIIWGAVTAVFVVVMIWRSLVAVKEEDILFLDPVEDKQAAEQKQIVGQVVRLTSYARISGITSAVLMLLAFGVWIYRGMKNF
jgi:hypothetical protein